MPPKVAHFPAVNADAALFGAVQTDYLTLTGTYSYPFRIGEARIWYDSGVGSLRIKHGSDPTSMTDGNLLMEG